MNMTLPATIAPPRRRSVKPRPLMPLSAVEWRLDRHEYEVITMIEEGELLWAFDVRAPKASHAELRVLTQSVQDYLAGRCSLADKDEDADWQRVARLIFPDQPSIVTGELTRSLSCGRQHAINLVYGRQFRLVPGSAIRPGPGGSPRLETASVAGWLRKRRVL